MVGDIVIGKADILMEIDAIVTNYGKTPALNVIVKGTCIPSAGAPISISDFVRAFCSGMPESRQGKYGEIGKILFPSQSIRVAASFYCRIDEVRTGLMEDEITGSLGGIAVIYVLVVVQYCSASDADLKTTCRTFKLTQKIENEQRGYFFLDRRVMSRKLIVFDEIEGGFAD